MRKEGKEFVHVTYQSGYNFCHRGTETQRVKKFEIRNSKFLFLCGSVALWLILFKNGSEVRYQGGHLAQIERNRVVLR